MAPSDDKRLIVVLSDGAPVTIHPQEWPQISWAGDPERGLIRVREHYQDERVLVYGARRGAKAGFLLAPDEDVVEALFQVADDLDVDPGVLREALEKLPPVAV